MSFAKNALKTLCCEVTDIIDYKLPLEEDYTRALIVIKKINSTPAEYPRSTQSIKKSPL